MKYLTEAEAWRVLAAQFAKPTRGEHRDKCLCWAVDGLHFRDGVLSRPTYDAMKARIAEQLGPDQGWAYEVKTYEGWTQGDCSPEAREARSMAALWFELEAGVPA